MYNIAILFSFIILLPTSLSGQSYITEYFGIKDGLPSNAMRSINEDRDGNVWLVTDNGIAQYNGNFFRVYNSFDNLKLKAVFDIFPSSDGRVYLIDYVKNLDYIYKDSLHTLVTGDFHIKVPYDYEGKTYGVDLDAHTYLINKDSVVNEYKSLDSGILWKMPKRREWRIAYPYAFALEGNTMTSFNLITFETSVKTFPEERMNLQQAISFHLYERIFFVNMKEAVVCYNPILDTFLYKDFTDSSTAAYRVKQVIFSKETIQLTTYNGLVVMDPDLEQIDSLRINTQAEGIISIFRDSRKNFWLLSNNGLGYISSYFRNMTLYALKDIKQMTCFNNKFYLLNSNGQISVYDTMMHLQRNIAVEDVISANNSAVFYRILDRKDSLVIATNKNITIIKKNGQVYSLRPNKLSKGLFHSIKDIAYSKNNLNVLTSEGITQVDVLSNTTTYAPIGRYSRIFSGRNDSFFIFDNNNSYLLKDKQLSPYTNKLFDSIKKVTGFSIPDFFIANDSNWIAGTNNYIFCLNIYTDKLSVFKVNDNITFMKCENDDLWIATMSKIYRYKKGKSDEYVFHSMHYNFSYSLYQGLQDIAVIGDHFFLVSNYGITKVPEKEMVRDRDNNLDTINIGRIIYGKENHYSDEDTAITLPYQPSNISIYFSYNTLGYDKEVTYSAYLEGIDEQWQSTNVNFVTYTSLKPGTYRLHYYASLTQYGLHSGEKVITISISPLWWQHYVFKVVVIVAILLILGFVLVKISLNRKNKMLRKALIERNISNVKLSALQSQMNPHFIFNAMASIQGFLKQNKNDIAEECLTEFSTLIRSYLDFSSRQFISLAQELETLKLYTSIEKKRFEGKFDVIFNVDTEKKLEDISMPPLIVQPFVENAIVHGLYHKLNAKGLLKIAFVEKEGNLIVTIDDNGIGRQKANSINAVMKKTASRGLELISERIRILNESSILSINIDTTDKRDMDGEPDGLLVTIYIKKQQSL